MKRVSADLLQSDFLKKAGALLQKQEQKVLKNFKKVLDKMKMSW
jgi:hypothetical protein